MSYGRQSLCESDPHKFWISNPEEAVGHCSIIIFIKVEAKKYCPIGYNWPTDHELKTHAINILDK